MPPKKAEKSKVQDPAKTPHNYEVTREPLPSTDPPTEVSATKDWDGYSPLVTDALFPEWVEGELDNEEWHSESDAFVDNLFDTDALPFWVRANTVGWERACDFVWGRQADLNPDGIRQAETTDNSNSKGRDAEQQGLGEVDVDDSTGKRLPRVVVLEPVSSNPTTSVPQWPPPRSLPLRRGFAKQTGGQIHGESHRDGVLAPHSEMAVHLKTASNSLQEQDSIGASLLRLVATYSATYLARESTPFLWEAIFPQDVNGQPRYNPGGKYAVKLFVSGRWRKVLVDDRVPVDSSGQATIVSSYERYELWPVILAKAMYKVAHLSCHSLLQAPGLSPNSINSMVAVMSMALTGWLPSPISGPPPPSQEWSQSANTALAARVVAGGTPSCSTDEVSLASTCHLPGSPSKRRYFRSGRRRRRGRSREPSDEMLREAASSRNASIVSMQNRFAAARDELFLVVQVDEHGNVMLKPILAVVVTPGINECNKKHALLDWSCASSKPEDFQSGAIVPSTEALAIPFDDLLGCAGSFSLLTLATCQNMPFVAQTRCQWLPAASYPSNCLYIEALNNPGTLVVALQADVLKDSPEVNSSGKSKIPNTRELPNSTLKLAQRDVVLILEEVLVPSRGDSPTNVESSGLHDHQSPRSPRNHTFESQLSLKPNRLTFLRLTLPLDSPTPFKTAAITIPPATRGRLYRLLIQAPVGAVATFCGNVPVICDEMSTVYTRLGGSVINASGSYCAVHDDSEVVIFRRLVTLPVEDVPAEENKSPRRKSPREDDLEKDRDEDLTHGESLSVDTGLALWLSDAGAYDHITLHTYNVDTAETTSHAVLQLPQMRILRSGRGIVVTATLRTTDATLRSGSWSLTAFSRVHSNSEASALKIRNIDNQTSGIPIHRRFGASYVPNKHLRLFRDILEVPPECFPLYLKIDVTHDDSNCKRVESRLPIRFGIYELAKRVRRSSAGVAKSEKDVVIATAKNGGGSKGDAHIERAGINTICLPCLWPQQSQSTGIQLTTEANVHLVIEAELDSNILQVDEELRSPSPYAFTSSILTAKNKCVGDKSDTNPDSRMADVSSPPQLQWFLTLYSAAEGLAIRHDSCEEKARQALRKTWEANEPGRAERAAAIHTLYLESMTKLTRLASKEAVSNDELLEGGADMARITALGSRLTPLELEKDREVKRRILGNPVVDEAHAESIARPNHYFNESAGAHSHNCQSVSENAGLKTRDWQQVENRATDASKLVRKLVEWRKAFVEGVVVTLAAREQHRQNTQLKTASLAFIKHWAQTAASKTKQVFDEDAMDHDKFGESVDLGTRFSTN